MSETDFRSDDAKAEAEQAAAADEAVTGARADLDSVDEESLRAADGLTVDPEVAASYEAAMERGANQQGEGRIP